jgi:hypothetical protein
MNARVVSARFGSMWDGRCAPWLQQGATPGSYRIKAPPRVQRSANGPLPWPPHLWALAAAASGGAQRRGNGQPGGA